MCVKRLPSSVNNVEIIEEADGGEDFSEEESTSDEEEDIEEGMCV